MNTVRNRALMPEEVECRIDSISAKSVTLVVYITARSAMFLMDELYGAGNYDKYIAPPEKKSVDTPFYTVCTLHVHDGENDFIVEDVGEDYNSPKAAASDALKRATMNLIPALRALYTLPVLRVNASALGIRLSSNPTREEMKEAVRFKKFRVNGIAFGKSAVGEFVKYLQIVDEETGDTVLEYASDKREYRAGLSQEELDRLHDFRLRMAKAHVTEAQMCTHYGVKDIKEILSTENVYSDALVNLDSRQKKVEAGTLLPAPAKSRTGNEINDQLGGRAEQPKTVKAAKAAKTPKRDKEHKEA